MEIRNFVIISHIDHGKSTLADRLLEITETVQKGKMQSQFLDSMDLEREKGITIKMTPVKMIYKKDGKEVMINLIDTPGHIDFNYEVSRSLAAVEGAILLVDATKGIQAQTITNLDLAKKEGLKIIPAINKIDSIQARPDETKLEIATFLDIDIDDIFSISAKTGENVRELLDRVISEVPYPEVDEEKPFRAMIFDSKYDPFLGVVSFIRVMEGKVSSGQKISLINSKAQSVVKELGVFKPEMTPINELKSGEIGYIATGIKDPEKIRIGDTIVHMGNESLVEALPGYKDPEPKLFVSMYPQDQEDFETLKVALSKLKLNDSALFYQHQNFHIFGRGFLCGFLGTLHTEIIMERLRREFGLELIIGAPQVKYKAMDGKGEEVVIYNSANWSDSFRSFTEPWAEVRIIIGESYLGRVYEYLSDLEGKHMESYPFGAGRYMLIYEMPLREIIGKFYENLLNITQGYASLTYRELEYRPAELVKLEIYINGVKEEAFSRIVTKERSFQDAKKLVEKLKQLLPRQAFAVPIQGKIGGKIISRETISATRKDVLAPLYGGDYTRKKKLLEKQKKGKQELKEKGEIRIPSEVFLKAFED
ncbi:MAG: translation elongation factor 4 [Minisyncoccus archaeiphilus]|uniref:translation elongation factor 4 n=1 Tax=Minisyncoccus archaeiphilus TaxID=3238481 RepID=UPI0009D3223B|nr:MAG: Elongation factor 4 [Parcubacteria group bacterium ADurb.Bin216]GMX59925.1 MAG: translation elongation factor 4 [Candidatus Parcubacteria bacterium]